MLSRLACIATAAVTVTAVQLPGDDYNTNLSLSFNSTLSKRALMCTQPPNGVAKWYYKNKSYGPYVCSRISDDIGQWGMLNAYRSGGSAKRHWIYTNNENNPDCLENWTYYGKNGKDVIAHITGRTTTLNDKKRWCALPVYQADGVEGKQWAYCDCTGARS